MRVSRRNKLFAVASATGLMIALAGPAIAEPISIEINPPKGFVVDGAEGEEYPLPSVPVASAHQGQECTITIFAENGQSLHPGNKLVIRSDGNLATVDGIEEEPNLTVELDATMIVGDTLELGLVFGPDGQSSLDLSVDLECTEPEGDSSSGSDEIVTTTTTTLETPETTVELSESEPVISEAETTTTTVQESEFLSEVNSIIPSAAIAELPGIAPPAQAVAGSPVYTG